MTERRPWFTATQLDGTDMASELLRFGEVVGLDRIARGRYSLLLLLGLFGATRSRKQNPATVVREIEALEGLREAGNLKPATQFNRPPLKGLWEASGRTPLLGGGFFADQHPTPHDPLRQVGKLLWVSAPNLGGDCEQGRQLIDI